MIIKLQCLVVNLAYCSVHFGLTPVLINCSNRFYCDYCDTYLTHDSVSSLFLCFHLWKGEKKVVISDVFCSRSISCNVFCCCFSHQWGRPTAVAESTKKMWKITIRNGWRSRLRASSIKQVFASLFFWKHGRVHVEVSLFSGCSWIQSISS